MFAPLGYLRWIEVQESIEIWAQAVIMARIAEAEGENPTEPFRKLPPLSGDRMVRSGLAETYGQARFTYDLLQAWMMCRLIAEFEPLAVSSSGQLMRPTPAMLVHADEFRYIDWTWPPFKNPDLKSLFQLHERNGLSGHDIQSRFHVIDPESGLICEKNGSAAGISNSGGLLEAELSDPLKFIRPYLGWALCWNSDIDELETSEILLAVGLDEEAEWANRVELEIPAGSKNLVEAASPDVVSCMLEAFPNGKGHATWKNVVAKVGYSRRTILRAVDSDPRVKEWRR